MAGVVAVVAERRPRRRPQPQEPNGGRRALAGCWGCLHGRGPGHGPGALLTRHPHARAVTATGLSVTAVGLAALDLAGSAAASGHLLALLCLPVAGGLAAALRTSGATGALAGVSGEIAGATPVLGAGVIPDHG